MLLELALLQATLNTDEENFYHMDSVYHQFLMYLLNLRALPLCRPEDWLASQGKSKLLTDTHTRRNLPEQIEMLFASGKGLRFHDGHNVHLFYLPSA